MKRFDILLALAIGTMATTFSKPLGPTSASAFVQNGKHHRRMPTTRLFQQADAKNNRRAFLRIASSAVASSAVLSTQAAASDAITPEQASKSYDTYASTYDDLDGGSIASTLGIDDARKTLLQSARGHVLEIGVGTGLNLDSYPFDDIKSLTLVDISDGMLSQARQRVERLKGSSMRVGSTPIRFVKADATSELFTIFGENAFDTAVDTFSLCVMGNEGAKRCLSEMAKVVKTRADGGKILAIKCVQTDYE